MKWPQKLHLLREKYHHGFEGNQCRALLKKVDVLERLVIKDCEIKQKDIQTHPAKVYIDALLIIWLKDALVKPCVRITVKGFRIFL